MGATYCCPRGDSVATEVAQLPADPPKGEPLSKDEPNPKDGGRVMFKSESSTYPAGTSSQTSSKNLAKEGSGKKSARRNLTRQAAGHGGSNILKDFDGGR